MEDYYGKERVCLRMKILITTDWYKPVINGVVTSVSNLCKGLEEAGHEVRILTLSDSFRAKKESNIYYMGSVNMEIVYPNARVSLNCRRLPKGAFRIGKSKCELQRRTHGETGNDALLKELIFWNPDVVHSQCEFSTFLFAKKIAKKCGAPLVHTYHTVYEEYTHYFCPSKTLGERLAAKFSKEILNRTQAVIVPSKKMKEMMERYGVEKAVHVIPSGISLEKYGQPAKNSRKMMREKLGISEDEFVPVYVGRLAKEKKLEEIFSLLREWKDPAWRLLIVGDGPHRAALERRAKEFGVERQLIFTGMVPQQEVQDYYSAGDVFVSASDSETQGMTYMEAMASGLPLLCKRDDCLTDVIDWGENGFLYEREEEFLDDLAMLKGSRAIRERIGEQARKTVFERYSIQAFAKACTGVYLTVCGQGKRGISCIKK